MTLLYFAWIKEKVGLSEETVDLPADVDTVAKLIDWLKPRSSGHSAAFAELRGVRAAVDQVHAPLASSITGAREIAFFPPVTGG